MMYKKGKIKAVQTKDFSVNKRVVYGKHIFKTCSIDPSRESDSCLLRIDSNHSFFATNSSLYELFVEYKEKSGETKIIPLKYSNWQDILNKSYDKEQINSMSFDFEIVETYVEPDESIHCNRGADIDVAELKETDEIKWNRILKEYDDYFSEEHVNWREEFADSLGSWLMKNYKSPIKKKYENKQETIR